MSADLKVVQLRRAPLTDVPARLRLLADRIEAGEVPGDAAVIIVTDEQRRVRTYGYGNVGTATDTVGLVQMGLFQMLHSLTVTAPEIEPTPKAPA